MPDEEKQLLFWQRSHSQYGAIRNHAPLLWLQCVNEKGVTTGCGADPIGMRTAPCSGGCCWISESQRARSEKSIASRWFDEEFQCSTLDFFDLLRIDELPRRHDQRALFENLNRPAMRKSQIKSRFGGLSGHISSAHMG